MVQCRVCDANKPVGDFYPRQVRICGTVGECKECTKSRVRQHRADNDNVREYDRARYRLPERKEANAENARRWRRENPEAYRAQTAVNNAIRDRRLHKQPCVECGANDNLHAHHPDYSKPLDVVWYCALHHQRHHAAQAHG